MKRAVFMGSDSFSIPILSALLKRGESLSVPVTVAGVVTQPDRPAGRGRRVAAGPVKVLAEYAAIPVLQPERVRSAGAVTEILNLRPDVVVVASYGQILPSTLLDEPPGRALNLHPSLLPCYRGSSPIAAPILAGDTVTGTTLMLMSARMDAGPILDQRVVPIAPGETAGELATKLADESADLLLADLPAWLSGEIEPRAQDENEATYTQRVTKEDGAIDWQRSADEIDRQVRAYTPWPGAFTRWNDTHIKILEASPVSGSSTPGLVRVTENGEILVGTGNGLLDVQLVQPAGGKPMAMEAFVRGHPAIAGAILGS